MKKIRIRIGITVLILSLLLVPARAATLLVPVGRTIGLRLQTPGVTVADFQKEGTSPGKEAGLQLGDVILKVGEREIGTAQELQQALAGSGAAAELTVCRKGQERRIQVALDPGKSQLGVYVREGISGIGTVTYYDPETGRFGALGHGVNDGDGNLVEMRGGQALSSQVVEVKRGQAGTPGQLRGAFSDGEKLGRLTANTARGLFGTCEQPFPGEPMPAAEAAQVHTGKAEILSNVSGTSVRRYDVEILRLYPEDRSQGRNILLRVTDGDLIAETGGIVQGMSGSPILQDGRLVGAVTHVLVNDPKTGYGIFIENMLDAAA